LDKIRLDLLLVKKELARSREKAQAMIGAGEVWVNQKLIDKPGVAVDAESHLEIKSKLNRYVSRGGLKMEKALKDFEIDCTGRVVLDIGASTGGYTDCVLQHGALKVYALDVGYGQLDWHLRNDTRVVNLEKTNIRYVQPGLFPEAFDLITIDVSFISTGKVFPVLPALLLPAGQVVSLVKPQFEAEKRQVGKKGVIKNKDVHAFVLARTIASAREQGLYCSKITFSPLTGPKGNIEFFILLSKSFYREMDLLKDICPIVNLAHENFRSKAENENTVAEQF
jgi:23S rRNA (cytidine1920-2'-O)/16S rRNA (cytidine1409-2'-O)-methyltransferase